MKLVICKKTGKQKIMTVNCIGCKDIAVCDREALSNKHPLEMEVKVRFVCGKCGYALKDGDVERFDGVCPVCGVDWWGTKVVKKVSQ